FWGWTGCGAPTSPPLRTMAGCVRKVRAWARPGTGAVTATGRREASDNGAQGSASVEVECWGSAQVALLLGEVGLGLLASSHQCANRDTFGTLRSALMANTLN